MKHSASCHDDLHGAGNAERNRCCASRKGTDQNPCMPAIKVGFTSDWFVISVRPFSPETLPKGRRESSSQRPDSSG